ncbi:MAG: hypothetical protein GX922_07855 [Firmicutes bacterium]|nr:hypothetical protein [Bacillota bacterium]
MKKLLTLILVMVLCLVFFAGCAQNQTGAQPEKQPQKEVADNSDQEVEQTEEPLDVTELSPTPSEDKETHSVVLYFPDHDLMCTYRIKTEIAVRKNEQVAKAALEAWIKGPDHKELTGLVPANLIVEYVEEVNGVAHVSFSKEVKDINLGSGGELMFAEQIAMIMQQFGYQQTQILVEGKKVEQLLGHLYVGEPIVADSPERFPWIDEKDPRDFVLQNVAFRIYEPAPGAEVKDKIVISGLARVFEASFSYEFKDGDVVFDKGFTTATEGAPGWGKFEIVIDIDNITSSTGTVFIYETSAKDGSRVNELRIPVKIVK